jgi:outer membrane protein OmpA-like peptidoglycan-associated protein
MRIERSSTRLLAAAAAGVLAASCALTPPGEGPLAQARDAYSRVQAEQNVTRFAPGELAEAGRALNQAEQLASRNADGEAVAHQAYLAKQRARIAYEVAMSRAAEAELQRADLERERAVAQARVLDAQAERDAERRRADAAEEALRRDALAAEEAREAREARQARASETRQREADLRAELAAMQQQIGQMRLSESERGPVLTLGSDVLFDSGRSTLKPGARHALERLAGFLQSRPGLQVLVEGFTDSVGGEGPNERLSADRARAVQQALVRQGVDGERITWLGKGEALPVASNDTAAGRQLNRRVEIVILRPSQEASAGVGR